MTVGSIVCRKLPIPTMDAKGKPIPAAQLPFNIQILHLDVLPAYKNLEIGKDVFARSVMRSCPSI